MPRVLTTRGQFKKRGSTLFLKLVIVLLAIVVLTWILVFPQLEGRAKNLDLISIYSDPFIIYGYIASIPFFVGLYQAFKLLNFIDANEAFSQGAVNTLKNMKFASLSLIGFIALAVLYIRFFAQGDDPAGPTALGIVISFASIVIATAAAVFQRLLQHAVDLQSEHDLTV
jgi:cytochrome bd-type quinol oxidase subunit 2